MHGSFRVHPRFFGGAAIVFLAGLTLAPAPAQAQAAEPSDAQWRQQMEAIVKSLQNEVQDLRAELKKYKSSAAAPTAEQAEENRKLTATVQDLQKDVAQAKAAAEKPKDAVKVTTKGGLTVESADGQYSFSPGGRLQVDSVWHNQDKARLGDGTEVRRAYLGASGKITSLWEYKVVAEFSDQIFKLNDATIQFNGLDPVRLTVGHFKAPFGLDQLINDQFTTFMERSLIDIFSPGRRIGAMADAEIGKFTLAAGIFGESAISGGDGNEADESTDIAARVTFTPALAKDEFIHLGLAGLYRDPTSIRFRQRPESHVTDATYLDTGTLTEANYDHIYAFQPEFGLVYGPFSLQGEYAWVQISRNDEVALVPVREDINLNGWYAEASVFLTGDTRTYKRGKFDRTIPKKNFLEGGGLGAIQLAARYSVLDFNDDGALMMEGNQRDITLGVTWVPHTAFRFMFNTVFVNTDHNALNASLVTVEEPFITGAAANNLTMTRLGNDSPTIFGFRAQADF